jgi:lysozyme
MTPAKKLALLFSACALCASGLVATEGWVLKAYKDPVHGAKVPTACAGVTQGIVLGKVYSEDECLTKTAQALVQHAGPITQCLPDSYPASGAPYLAGMVDTAYNIGVGAFVGSSMCRRMKAADYRGACEAVLLYKYAGGRDCSVRSNGCYGVWLRRQKSRADCLENLP